MNTPMDEKEWLCANEGKDHEDWVNTYADYCDRAYEEARDREMEDE